MPLDYKTGIGSLRCTAMQTAIFAAIVHEREFQDQKYGPVVEPMHDSGLLKATRPGPGGHELPGWLLVIEKELAEAKEAATGHGKKERTGRNSTRAELVQIAAVAVAALEQHGVEE